MATEIYITRHPTLPFLQADSPDDLEKIKALRHGETYRAKFSLPRNVRFHKKFFALLGIVFDNLPEDFEVATPDGQVIQIRSMEDLLWHIKMQIGHYEQRVTLGGRVTYEARSISFGAMDELEFSDFYKRAVDVILKYFLPGVDENELEAIVMDFA